MDTDKHKLMSERLKGHSSFQLIEKLNNDLFNNYQEKIEAVRILKGRKQDIYKWKHLLEESANSTNEVDVKENKISESDKTKVGRTRTLSPTIIEPQIHKKRREGTTASIIRQKWSEGKDYAEIADELGKSYQYIHAVINYVHNRGKKNDKGKNKKD